MLDDGTWKMEVHWQGTVGRAWVLPVLLVLFLRIELRVDGITVNLRRKQQSLWSQMKLWQLKITCVVCPRFSRSGEVPMGIWANRKIIFPCFSIQQVPGRARQYMLVSWETSRIREIQGQSSASLSGHRTMKHLTTLLPSCWSRGPESLGADSLLHEFGVWLFWPQALKQRDQVLKLHRPWFCFQVLRVNQESQPSSPEVKRLDDEEDLNSFSRGSRCCLGVALTLEEDRNVERLPWGVDLVRARGLGWTQGKSLQPACRTTYRSNSPVVGTG